MNLKPMIAIAFAFASTSVVAQSAASAELLRQQSDGWQAPTEQSLLRRANPLAKASANPTDDFWMTLSWSDGSSIGSRSQSLLAPQSTLIATARDAARPATDWTRRIAESDGAPALPCESSAFC